MHWHIACEANGNQGLEKARPTVRGPQATDSHNGHLQSKSTRVYESSQPTNQPTSQPANQLTNQPASQPANQPTNLSTCQTGWLFGWLIIPTSAGPSRSQTETVLRSERTALMAMPGASPKPAALLRHRRCNVGVWNPEITIQEPSKEQAIETNAMGFHKRPTHFIIIFIVILF